MDCVHVVCVSSGGPRADQPSGDVTGTSTTTGPDRKWAPSDSGSVEGRTGPNVGIVPDNQQLFVGNLPHNVDDEELVKFFTSELISLWKCITLLLICTVMETSSLSLLYVSTFSLIAIRQTTSPNCSTC